MRALAEESVDMSSDAQTSPPLTPSVVNARSFLAGATEDLAALLFLNREPVGPTVRLVAVGDIGLSGRVRATAQQKGYRSLFTEVEPVLQTGEITFGNLEFPLLKRIPPGSMFAAPVEAAPHLRSAGFTLLNLANNHILDFGPDGLRSTLLSLGEAGLHCFGAGSSKAEACRLLSIQAGTLRVGWFGSARGEGARVEGPTFWQFDEEELTRALSEARHQVDFLVVSMHAGFMYLDYPHPEHKRIAERLVAHGANLVLMHHPHVLQGVEICADNKAICFSLGNFILDWEEGNVRGEVAVKEQQEGAIFVFDVDSTGITRMAALPTYSDQSCQVRWALGERGEGILRRLSRLSVDLNGDFASAFFRQRAERNTGHAIKVLLFHVWRGNLSYVFSSLLRIRPNHVLQLFRWLGRRLGRGSAHTG